MGQEECKGLRLVAGAGGPGRGGSQGTAEGNFPKMCHRTRLSEASLWPQGTHSYRKDGPSGVKQRAGNGKCYGLNRVFSKIYV